MAGGLAQIANHGGFLMTTLPSGLPVVVQRADPVPLAVQISAQLEAAVTDGVLHAGDRLPSSRDLAVSLGVSRTVVTNPYARLFAEGWLGVRRGGRRPFKPRPGRLARREQDGGDQRVRPPVRGGVARGPPRLRHLRGRRRRAPLFTSSRRSSTRYDTRIRPCGRPRYDGGFSNRGRPQGQRGVRGPGGMGGRGPPC